MNCVTCVRGCDQHSWGSYWHFDMCSDLVAKLNHLICNVQEYCSTNPEETEYLEKAVYEAQALKHFVEKHQTNLLLACWSLLQDFEDWTAVKSNNNN